MFGSNISGVKSDILVSNEVSELQEVILTEPGFKFKVEGQVFDGFYTIEMKIPLNYEFS